MYLTLEDLRHKGLITFAIANSHIDLDKHDENLAEDSSSEVTVPIREDF